MARSSKALDAYEARVTEDYLVAQLDYRQTADSFARWKRRMEDGDMLYQGDLRGLFPNDENIPEIPFVANQFKNALHDISRLASEARGTVKFVARGAKDSDLRAAEMQEAINEGYWAINRMPTREHQLYLDLAGSGVMGAALYYDARSPYPQSRLLNPRFCYPDVRDGKLQSLLSAETVKERVLAYEFPALGLDKSADNTNDAFFVCLYDAEGVSEAVITAGKAQRVKAPWMHGLGRVPVAFEKLDTYDGAFHGLLEQLAGPLMVRNKIMRFVTDNLESIVHAPLEALNVLNADDIPGPETVYQHDPTKDRSLIGRVAPAPVPNGVFGVLSYMGDQEEREALQPPSRSGNVSQSIASGSFVDRTQGQLTSVVKELQDKMSSFREQFNTICMLIDEQHMDEEKPLYRPVGGKAVYTPSKAINGWYFHEVKFGAGAGLDRLNADTRVQNHLVARLITRKDARREIDYLDDSMASEDGIVAEQVLDAVVQRFTTDPNTQMSSLVRTWLGIKKKGQSFEDALEEVVPDMVAAEKAAQQPEGGPPAGDMLPEGAPPEGMPPEGGGTEQLKITAPMPPIGQVFPGRNYK